MRFDGHNDFQGLSCYRLKYREGSDTATCVVRIIEGMPDDTCELLVE